MTQTNSFDGLTIFDIVRIASFAGCSITTMLRLRAVNKKHREAIDDYSERTWFHTIKSRDIDFALRMRRIYMIRIIIKTVAWYNTDNNRLTVTYLPDFGTYKDDRLASEFICNKANVVDEVFIENGYIDRIATFNKEKEYKKRTALIQACIVKDYKRIKYLIDKGADVNLKADVSLYYPIKHLFADSLNGQMDSVEMKDTVMLFIQKGVNATNGLFTKRMTLPMIKLLVEVGKANINYNDAEDGTPLHDLSQRCPIIEVIKYLVERGADVTLLNSKGNNALVHCCLRDTDVIIDNARYLISIGMDFQTVAKRREVLNHLILFRDCRPLIKAVLLNNASGVVSDRTVGVSAEAEDEYQLVEVNHTAEADTKLDLSYIDATGETVFMKDILFPTMEMLVKHLDGQEDKSFILNIVSDKNESALSLAYKRKQVDIIRLLLDNGADGETLFNSVSRDKNDDGYFNVPGLLPPWRKIRLHGWIVGIRLLLYFSQYYSLLLGLQL